MYRIVRVWGGMQGAAKNCKDEPRKQCAWIDMYTSVSIFQITCMFSRTYTHTQTHTNTQTHTHIWIRTHTHTHTHTHTRIYVYVYIRIHAYIYICIYIHENIAVCIYVYIYTYVCIHAYVHMGRLEQQVVKTREELEIEEINLWFHMCISTYVCATACGYMYTKVYICICTRVYMHIYTHEIFIYM